VQLTSSLLETIDLSFGDHSGPDSGPMFPSLSEFRWHLEGLEVSERLDLESMISRCLESQQQTLAALEGPLDNAAREHHIRRIEKLRCSYLS